MAPRLLSRLDLLDRITGPETPQDCVDGDTQSLSGLRSRHSFPVNIDHYVVALVVALLALCYPAAVAGSVGTVHVDSVKRQAVGWAHISQKVLKLHPAFMHGNTASAVPLVHIAL